MRPCCAERGGEWWPGEGQATAEELLASLAEGWTLFVRHAERFDERIGGVADEFRRAFQRPIDVQLFCTPAQSEGFGWHYDAEEVFLLQTAGRKRYRLRKNTVHPWPLLEGMPEDLGYARERTPTMEVTLAAGDWLYIPSGYWHTTHALETSISLSVGVLARTAVDLVAMLKETLAESLLWRQRLPLVTDWSGCDGTLAKERLRPILTQLAKDLGQTLASEGFLERVVAASRTAISEPPGER